MRTVILESLDDGFEEGIQYGMIGYYVPHRLYPAGYHCDPKQPLPFLGLASQKNHLSLYLMGLYGDASERERFEREWGAAGLKLDMGKACLRFKRLEDLSLPILAESLRRMPSKRFIEVYEAAIPAKGRRARASTKATKGPTQASTKASTKTPAKPSTTAKRSTGRARQER